MNKIYVVMVMSSLFWDEQIKGINFGSERIVGWYSKYKDAYEDITNNACDIWEMCYQYALLEEIEEGLYCPAQNRCGLNTIKKKTNTKKFRNQNFVKIIADLQLDR